MNEKIIVTGAAGFIGSNLLAGLENVGFDSIVCVDDLSTDQKWKNVSKRYLVDYIPRENLYSYLNEHNKEIKAIIHLGAISTTTELDVDLILSTNYRLTLYLFKFCQDNSIQFIYASSAATYGDGSNGFEDISDVQYLHKLHPLNAYGWSKNLSDLFISRMNGFTRTGSQVVGLKFFNVYGPNEYHKGAQQSVISTFYEQLISNHKMNLFKSNETGISDGNQTRDFVYVNDCVDVILWFLAHPNISGLFNVGSGVASTFNQVAATVAKTIGMECNISYITMPENIVNQYQNHTCAEIKKLRDVGYQKEMTTIDMGIYDYIMNYLTKQDKYR